jgi:hypothetical protein
MCRDHNHTHGGIAMLVTASDERARCTPSAVVHIFYRMGRYVLHSARVFQLSPRQLLHSCFARSSGTLIAGGAKPGMGERLGRLRCRTLVPPGASFRPMPYTTTFLLALYATHPHAIKTSHGAGSGVRLDSPLAIFIGCKERRMSLSKADCGHLGDLEHSYIVSLCAGACMTLILQRTA